MDVLEAIKGRRATRSFTGEAVSRDVIVGLIDAAIAAKMWTPRYLPYRRAP